MQPLPRKARRDAFRSVRTGITRIAAWLLPLILAACSDMGLGPGDFPTSSLTSQETSLDCAQLSRIIMSEIARVKTMPATAHVQQEQIPATLKAVWTRMTGPPGADLPVMRDYAHSRARLRAFSAQHAANCRPPIDVEAELAETDRVMASAAWNEGTAADARALLDRTIDALKSDRTRTLSGLRAGADRFKDRDLHVVCASAADGAIVAGPGTAAANLRDLKDAGGRSYGAEMLAKAAEGRVAEIAYTMSPPGSEAPPRPRSALVTRSGDLVCSVSHWQ